nr:MAG TPA: hypothetical protein [Caudoviricetes sp.]
MHRLLLTFHSCVFLLKVEYKKISLYKRSGLC